MKTILISKHIHSCCASYSSNDIFLNVLTNSKEIDFKVKEGNIIHSTLFPFLNGEIIEEITGDKLFQAIYIKDDKTFYQKAIDSRNFFNSDYHKTPEFAQLISDYTARGWRIIKDIPEQNKYWKREELKREKKKKKDGFVLWMSYDKLKTLPISVYQGGFSDDLFNCKHIQEYLSPGGAFGWIGHFGTRKAELDKAIEEGLRKRGLSSEFIASWVTSSDGRHFADYIEGQTLEEQKVHIEKSLNQMFNLALIYSSEFHEGTRKSTEEIREDYKKQGILLPEDNSGYDSDAYLKLLLPVLANILSNKKK